MPADGAHQPALSLDRSAAAEADDHFEWTAGRQDHGGGRSRRRLRAGWPESAAGRHRHAAAAPAQSVRARQRSRPLFGLARREKAGRGAQSNRGAQSLGAALRTDPAQPRRAAPYRSFSKSGAGAGAPVRSGAVRFAAGGRGDRRADPLLVGGRRGAARQGRQDQQGSALAGPPLARRCERAGGRRGAQRGRSLAAAGRLLLRLLRPLRRLPREGRGEEASPSPRPILKSPRSMRRPSRLSLARPAHALLLSLARGEIRQLVCMPTIGMPTKYM